MNSDNNLIVGNFIGTDATGTFAISNTGNGVEIAASTGNTIGGTIAGAGNVISGNDGMGILIDGGALQNLVEGNLIGTDASGTLAIGNFKGVEIDDGSSGNTIGGSTAAARNIISGNTRDGVVLGGGIRNVVAGNYVGLNEDGTAALGNGRFGVLMIEAESTSGTVPSSAGTTSGSATSGGSGGGKSNLVGGTASGTGNVISGNAAGGIYITGGTLDIVAGNLIGTDATGTVAIGNGSGDGVELIANASRNTIGGAAAGDGNLISGNEADGVVILGAGTTDNVVAGNLIGTDRAGTVSLPNDEGIDIASGASGNTIGGTASGTGNLISGNQNAGVDIEATSTSNVVAGNQIGTDITSTVAVPNDMGIFVAGTDNTIGGTTAGAGNLISGNGFGVQFESPSSGNIVAGNLIGTDVTGTLAVPNGFGVFFAHVGGDTIGGTIAAARNVISGNGDGVYLGRFGSTGIVVEGNLIGTDITGTLALPNGVGVLVNLGAHNNTIGGMTSGAGNVISGNTIDGVEISNGNTSGNLVAGNDIGTDVTGAVSISNGTGVEIDSAASSNTIGGTTAGAGNVISGNSGDGVDIADDGTTSNVVAGNKIGTDSTGSLARPNAVGIEVDDVSGNTIGGTTADAGNMIAFNTGDAIDVDSGTGDAILRNLIFSNGAGIVLISGGNDDQIAPVITSVSSEGAVGTPAQAAISVDLTAVGFTAGATYSLDFFASAATDPSGGAEAHFYLGTATFTGGTSGVVTLGLFTPPLTDSQTVTATATLLSGSIFTDTSALAAPAVVIEVSDFIVTTTSATGAGSLEQGIQDANASTANPSAYVILFDITTGTAPYTIDPVPGGLTPITHAVVLDAESEPGYAGSPIIVLDGTGVSASGLMLSDGSDGSAIRGFDIINFTASVTAGIEIDSGGNLVQSNYVGLQSDGSTVGSNTEGVLVKGSNNTIGGATFGTGNVISGNTGDGIELNGAGTSGNVVAGNLIGTDVTGLVGIGNGSDGVEIDDSGSGNTIGGTTASARNIIAGNATQGVEVDSFATGNVIAGNYIGTDLTGDVALGNSTGIWIISGSNTIGGTVTGAGNVITGNDGNAALNLIGGIQVAIGGSLIPEGTPQDNVVQGNLIGLDASGQALDSATNSGVVISSDASGNTIGGITAAARNVISGNLGGVRITGTGNVIAGNYIGTDTTGIGPIGNGTVNAGIFGPGPGGNGIAVDAADNTIGGTASGAGNLISGNSNDGVELSGAGTFGNLVAGNEIGTDYTGAFAVNNNVGVQIDTSAAGNTIGGLTASSRNVISGNDTTGVAVSQAGIGNVIVGNYIGPDATGENLVRSKAEYGDVTGVSIVDTSGTTIGGTVSGAGNLISGNSNVGINIIGTSTTDTLVAGNLIGTDALGTTSLGNFGCGVSIVSSGGNTIGGVVAGAGNVISGNGRNGLSIAGPGANDNLVQGNWIGTNATDAETIPNGNRDVRIEEDATGNTIGGSTAAARNIISDSNGDGVVLGGGIQNLVEGNYIGVNDSGTATAGNARYGVYVLEADRTSNSVTSSARTTSGSGFSSGSGGGKSNAVVGNVISGNSRGGIYVAGGTLDIFSGNLIGTDATGSIAIGNGFAGDGIQLTGDASGNTIGGTGSGAGNVIVAGNSGDGDGVEIDALASGNVIPGNRIGTDSAGTVVLGRASVGILIDSINNTVGGTSAGAGNLISGNSTGISVINALTLIEGNLIGTDVTGTIALGNGIGVQIEAADNTLGGSSAGAGNVISGSTQYGVEIEFSVATGNLVEGNLIGTDKSGTAALGNVYGVVITSATDNTIGGTTAGAGNVISGNFIDGVNISVSSDIVVAGNVIGLNAAGSAALGNSDDGIWLSLVTDSTIGGTTVDGRNVISGNLHYGVEFSNADETGNVVEGNFIGTNATGTTAFDKSGDPLGNTTGIYVRGVTFITIGGTTPGSGNLISGNVQFGVELFGTTLALIQGNEIGTAASGMTAFDSNGKPLGNGVGVVLTDDASDNFVGGSSPADRNIISGNLGVGVGLDGDDNYVQGNYIGTDLSGTTSIDSNGKSLGNDGGGVSVFFADNNTIGGITDSPGTGAGNLISGNSGDGISLMGTEDTVIFGNLIGTDLTGTLAIANAVGIDSTNGYQDSIGGAAAGAGNVISGNSGDGVTIGGATDDVVAGNLIGTSADGSAALGNSSNGVDLTQATGITIGGTASGAGNLISGNTGDGVLLAGPGTTGNLIEGSLIGTDITGNAVIANGTGVEIDRSASGNTVGGLRSSPGPGLGNVISGNDGPGVFLNDTTDNLVEGDYIGTDVTGTLALPNNSGPDQTALSGGVTLYNGSAGNTIGGQTAIPGTGAGNVISGNGSSGIDLEYAGSGNLIVGDLIGTDASGRAALGNTLPLPLGSVFAGTGVRDEYSPGTTIGEVGGSNVISGNGAGTDNASNIYMIGSGGSVIQSNYIGTDITGTISLASTNVGVWLSDGSYKIGGLTSTPGTGLGNLISGNQEFGILYDDYSAPETLLVEGNNIGADVTGENALPDGLAGISLAQASLVTIGGTASGARNLITGSPYFGYVGDIWLADSSDNVIQGNYVGTDITGTSSLALLGGVGGAGVYMDEGSADNLVGGTTPAARNIVAGFNDPAVYINGAGTSGNLVEGNFIGTNASGTAAIPNTGPGVELDSGASGNTIGGIDGRDGQRHLGQQRGWRESRERHFRRPGRRELDRHRRQRYDGAGKRRRRRVHQPGFGDHDRRDLCNIGQSHLWQFKRRRGQRRELKRGRGQPDRHRHDWNAADRQFGRWRAGRCWFLGKYDRRARGWCAISSREMPRASRSPTRPPRGP